MAVGDEALWTVPHDAHQPDQLRLRFSSAAWFAASGFKLSIRRRRDVHVF
jgi:hypothetical protein